MKFFTINDINLIDLDALTRMLPGNKGWSFVKTLNRGRYITAMLRSWEVLDEASINTPKRLAHFLGQGLIETGFLNHVRENMSYSEQGLLKTFSVYKNNPALAKKHARNQRLIANTTYGTRMGNKGGDDGWNYRGRGFIQLTGRNNYEKYADLTGFDIVNKPDLIAKNLKASIAVAAEFWKQNNLNQYADLDDIKKVSRAINYGNANRTKPAHGEDERILWTNYVKRLTGDETMITDGAEMIIGPASDRAAVRQLQEDLNFLGFKCGKPDGLYGRNTKRALVAFQFEHELATTGTATQVTLDAMEEAMDGKAGAGSNADADLARAYEVGMMV